jgi:hypothetical protein
MTGAATLAEAEPVCYIAPICDFINSKYENLSNNRAAPNSAADPLPLDPGNPI